MNHDAPADTRHESKVLERHRTRGADAARVVLFRRLNRTARDNPAAVLGVLAWWLGPHDSAEPDARQP
jgi:hypothetical protein